MIRTTTWPAVYPFWAEALPELVVLVVVFSGLASVLVILAVVVMMLAVLAALLRATQGQVAAPILTASARVPALVSKATTEFPFSRRFLAMPRPMLPRPTNPTADGDEVEAESQ